MSGELPSAWGQVCPRSVRLAPNGLLVPAATLRVLLREGRPQDLIYTGFALEPSVRDGEIVRVSGVRVPRRGDLLLCEVDGWGDLLRGQRRSHEGAWTAALDAFPARRMVVPADRILGAVETVRGCPARLLAIGGLSRLRGPAATLRFALRRALRAPDFPDRPAADASVMEKYRQQVAGYRTLGQSALSEDLARILCRHVPVGGTILVGGSGVGSEAIHLARQGFQVSGFDALPEMVASANEAAMACGVRVEFLCAEIAALDLPDRRFDAIYLTPLLYSFLAGRDRRIAALRGLARHLSPGGPILLSAQPYRGAAERLQTSLAVARRRLRGSRIVEAGDWYTWFLTPQGTIGSSYLHRFARGEVEGEIAAAGFQVLARIGAHILAVCSAPSTAGQKSSSFRKWR